LIIIVIVIVIVIDWLLTQPVIGIDNEGHYWRRTVLLLLVSYYCWPIIVTLLLLLVVNGIVSDIVIWPRPRPRHYCDPDPLTSWTDDYCYWLLMTQPTQLLLLTIVVSYWTDIIVLLLTQLVKIRKPSPARQPRWPRPGRTPDDDDQTQLKADPVTDLTRPNDPDSDPASDNPDGQTDSGGPLLLLNPSPVDGQLLTIMTQWRTNPMTVISQWWRPNDLDYWWLTRYYYWTSWCYW